MSEATKWTAGRPQWRRYGPPYKIPINCESGTVANVLTHDSIDWRSGKQPEPSVEARMVAASPEMFAAIKGALRIADLWRPNEDWREEHWEEAKALYMMLSQFEELVKKVEGNG